MNQTDHNPQTPQNLQPYYYPVAPEEDEIDLFELFASLFAQWKIIIALTIVGSLIAIAIAQNIPNLYETSSSVRIPKPSQINIINENGLYEFTAQQLFDRYYNEARATVNQRNFQIQANLLPKLFPDLKETDINRAAIKFSSRLSFNIIEPKAGKGQILESPYLFNMSLFTSKEPESVALLNGYMQHIRKKVLQEIREEGKQAVELRSISLNREIKLLRLDAQRNRALLIEKLTEQNNEKRETLQQKISLLRTGASENRLLQIEKMKESNKFKIETLEQQISFHIDQEKKRITRRSTSLSESYEQAKKADIIKMTHLDSFANLNKPDESVPQTQINVTNNRNFLEFLLGTEYLSSQIDILKNRKNLAQFIPEIPKLEAKIDSLKNDIKLKELQNRVSDDPYIKGLQNLLGQITALKDDKRITALKVRKSDDPYIKLLPEKLNELERLKRITFEFGDASLYTIDKAATVDGLPEEPNRRMIVLLGTLVSGVIALFVALIVATVKKRALSKES
ncbi:MAG: hypothetical protein GY786_11770 [Proteobacteria bacterium]|nr:hypothetical protein [Pseudomonadota bacterium]